MMNIFDRFRKKTEKINKTTSLYGGYSPIVYDFQGGLLEYSQNPILFGLVNKIITNTVQLPIKTNLPDVDVEGYLHLKYFRKELQPFLLNYLLNGRGIFTFLVAGKQLSISNLDYNNRQMKESDKGINIGGVAHKKYKILQYKSNRYTTSMKPYLSPVEVAKESLTTLRLSKKLVNATLQNSGVQRVVSLQGSTGLVGSMSETQEEEFDNTYNNTDNLGKVVYSKKPLKIDALSSSPYELRAEESEQRAIEQLCTVYNIPIELVVPTQSTYNNKKEALKYFLEYNCTDLMNSILSLVNEAYTEYGIDIELSVDRGAIPELSDISNTREKIAMYKDLGYTPEEIRDLIDV